MFLREGKTFASCCLWYTQLHNCFPFRSKSCFQPEDTLQHLLQSSWFYLLRSMRIHSRMDKQSTAPSGGRLGQKVHLSDFNSIFLISQLNFIERCKEFNYFDKQKEKKIRVFNLKQINRNFILRGSFHKHIFVKKMRICSWKNVSSFVSLSDCLEMSFWFILRNDCCFLKDSWPQNMTVWSTTLRADQFLAEQTIWLISFHPLSSNSTLPPF